MNKLYKGDNPFMFVKRYPKVKVKVKLPDDVRDRIKDYCEGKAFDYNPHFLLIVATVLYTGFRGNEIYGLRWTEPKRVKPRKQSVQVGCYQVGTLMKKVISFYGIPKIGKSLKLI
jgi:hypothetical protein